MQREGPKKIWLFSYGASGPSISNTIWTSSTGIDIDECYTLSQRDFKYTLIHTTKRISPPSMKSAVTKLETVTGIKGAGIFGYDNLLSGIGVSEHPGMKLMIEHMNKESTCFEYWLQSGSIESNRRSLLNKYLDSHDLCTMSKPQLLNYIHSYKRKLESKLQEQDSKILELEQENEEMETELGKRMDRIKTLKSENKMLRSFFTGNIPTGHQQI